MCGVNASALSYWTGGDNWAHDRLYRGETMDWFVNDTGHWIEFYNTSIYGTKVLISDEPHDPGQMFKASFLPLTSDHALWNNYQIPELKVNIKQSVNEHWGK